MTKENIFIEKVSKSCKNCGETMDFKRFVGSGKRASLELGCPDCSSLEKVQIKKDFGEKIHIAIIDSSYYKHENVWLVFCNKGCFTLKSDKAHLPDLDELPSYLREPIQTKMDNFFRF